MPPDPLPPPAPIQFTRSEDPQRVYANSATFAATPNEFVIDLFLIEPSSSDPPAPVSKHIQRIILPIGVVKGFVTGMANTIAELEAVSPFPIPNQREPTPNDKIKIW